MFRLKLNKNALWQYFLIYISLQYLNGRVAIAIGSDIFYGACLVIGGIYLIINFKKSLKESGFWITIGVISLLGLFTCFITSGGLSIATVLSLISRFLIVYASIKTNEQKYIERFVNLSFIFAIVSLILFVFVQVVGVENAKGIMSNLYEIKNSLSWMPSSYGLFIICYNFRNASRNSYMFGEPGLYQMMIILAIYFSIFKGNCIKKENRMKYLIVFLLTFLTIQSTTGFINLFALLGCILFSKKIIINNRAKRFILLGVILLLIYAFAFGDETNILYTGFLDKIRNSEGTLDLTVSTGNSRIVALENLLTFISEDFLGFIIGIGYSGIVQRFREYTCSGIVNSIMMFGIISVGLNYGYLFKRAYKGCDSISEFIFIIIMIINNGLSQPDLLSITTVIVALSLGYYMREDNQKHTQRLLYEQERTNRVL